MGTGVHTRPHFLPLEISPVNRGGLFNVANSPYKFCEAHRFNFIRSASRPLWRAAARDFEQTAPALLLFMLRPIGLALSRHPA